MTDHGIDHLFRHQYGKMVSILTRIFGLEHLETVEDAIQDTFIKAMQAWRTNPPENPEAWLMQASKNRILDLIRKLQAEEKRAPKIASGPAAIALQELFLDHEIADSQLRMIFTSCHPSLKGGDQIAFALKTISGFSTREIAGALLLKEETVKKRLSRARKTIVESGMRFEIPYGHKLELRLQMVLRVLYLIFNEGFHSNRQDMLVREELCGEALRLCRALMDNPHTKNPDVYALFALFCFQLVRLKSKVAKGGEIISLEKQDRTLWNRDFMKLGDRAMTKAVETDTYTPYHFEAAIAAEHIKAKSYEETNWNRIFRWYTMLYEIQPTDFVRLNMAMAQLQRGENEECKNLLQSMQPQNLEQRGYLYYGLWAEYHHRKGDKELCLENMDRALSMVQNEQEREYLEKRRKTFCDSL